MFQKIYCEKCNDFVGYITEPAELFSEDLKVSYSGEKAFCKHCNTEVNTNNIEFDNLKRANAAWELKNKK